MNKVLSVNDKMYVIMTEDKKCILRGRKNTSLVLSLIDEKDNHKLFTCRQPSEVVSNLNSDMTRVWLTDNAKKLYSDKKPKLIAVRAYLEYRVEL